MRLLLVCSSFNSLSQRLFVELREAGHTLAVEIDAHEDLLHRALDRFEPDLILAPYLRRAIPASVLARVLCLIVHPGPPGDAGPAALDNAILDGMGEWGVTVLEATEALDAGPVRAARWFPLRPLATKSDLYANEVTEAAVAAVMDALDQCGRGAPAQPAPAIRWRDKPAEDTRAISFSADDVATIRRKVASGDGMPGAVATILGERLRVFDVTPETSLTGPPGAVIARREHALCLGARDGAVWVGHVKPLSAAPGERPFKRAAASHFSGRLSDVPVSAMPGPADQPEGATLQDITYRERDGVGHLGFDFYNGGMSAPQARRLLAALKLAAEAPARVLVLHGGRRFWSTGMDLMAIEAAASAADESWASINAIDDVVEALIRMTGKLTIAALGGNAGAGGAFMALASDRVIARRGVVLNPHYRNMGNLHGSEYWTYLIGRQGRGAEARALVEARMPVGAAEALRAGFIDAIGEGDRAAFAEAVHAEAASLARDGSLAARLAQKAETLARDEATRPLAADREAELARMREAFYGFDPSYHVARYNFIAKVPLSRTPLHLQAEHGAAVGVEG
jgi:putative two-component system hydrogenase maturation factor HypX/HoxX